MDRLCVLIVEDEPLIALELEAIVLGRFPQAEVLLATSVEGAMAAIASPLTFALLDVDVTDGKTYPLARLLRARNVPFVFVSGAASRETPPDIADAGFVPKPFSPLDIIRSIEKATGERE